MRARALCGTLLLAAGAATAADPIPAGGPADLTGPRALALSASIGAAAGNDGIYVNPGALAARKRYSAEAGLLVDRRGADTTGQFLGASVVDSQTDPRFTAGFSFVRAQKGTYEGNLWHLALAGPLGGGMFLGVTGKYLSLSGPDKTSAATVDAGLFWQVADYVSIGVVGHNLVDIGNEAAAPRSAGAGIALGSDTVAQVTGDWRADFDRVEGKTTNRYAVGAEVLLGRLVPLRAGFERDETLGARWWSIGAGLVSPSAALDLGYRQSTDDPSARMIAATLKLFIQQ